MRRRRPAAGGAGVVLGRRRAAVLAKPDGRVVASTDLLVDGRHFRRTGPPRRVGRKAAAQNLADVGAVGAVPTGLLLGLAVPPDLRWAG